MSHQNSSTSLEILCKCYFAFNWSWGRKVFLMPPRPIRLRRPPPPPPSSEQVPAKRTKYDLVGQVESQDESKEGERVIVGDGRLQRMLDGAIGMAGMAAVLIDLISSYVCPYVWEDEYSFSKDKLPIPTRECTLSHKDHFPYFVDHVLERTLDSGGVSLIGFSMAACMW